MTKLSKLSALLKYPKLSINVVVILTLGLPACLLGYAYGIISSGFSIGKAEYEKFRTGD